jgi:hypothetical protein
LKVSKLNDVHVEQSTCVDRGIEWRSSRW